MDPLTPPPDPAGAAAPPRATLQQLRAAHWKSNRNMSAALLAAWLLTTFCSAFYARALARLTLFGWPLSFYMAAQGAALIYLALIGLYAWRMRRLDLALRAQLELP